jgi:para-nitrobenzyl esterase
MVAGTVALLAVSSVLVTTESGVVRGTCPGSVCFFKNIPYAAPPTGESRWKAPQPPFSWEGERDATEWGPVCPQIRSGNFTGSEDCLQLNVFTPGEPSGERHPVLVWIHGGSHTSGSGILDGQRFVDRAGIVLVTINYRLGPLGYMAHAVLRNESPDRTTGAYGTLDQIAALGWVQRNIDRFGGDPARVAIAGHSAGSYSVCAIVASPLARGLFTSAILQSGGCGTRSLRIAEQLGDALGAVSGCGWDTACLRAIPAEEVLRLHQRPEYSGPAPAYAAAVDGYVLADVPENVIARGEHNHVPAIIGCTSDEESRTSVKVTNEREYRQAIWNMVPVPGADTLILREYPVWEYPSYQAAYVAAVSDQRYVCPARRAARAFRGSQSEPVFRYVFTHSLDNSAELRPFGAWHGADVMYLFDTLENNNYVASEGERMLVEVFAGYWSQLAAAGDPRRPGLPDWPLYQYNDVYLRIDSEISVGEGYRKRQCDFWDELPSKRPPGY